MTLGSVCVTLKMCFLLIRRIDRGPPFRGPLRAIGAHGGLWEEVSFTGGEGAPVITDSIVHSTTNAATWPQRTSRFKKLFREPWLHRFGDFEGGNMDCVKCAQVFCIISLLWFVGVHVVVFFKLFIPTGLEGSCRQGH